MAPVCHTKLLFHFFPCNLYLGNYNWPHFPAMRALDKLRVDGSKSQIASQAGVNRAFSCTSIYPRKAFLGFASADIKYLNLLSKAKDNFAIDSRHQLELPRSIFKFLAYIWKTFLKRA